jgi:hypothetical protein
MHNLGVTKLSLQTLHLAMGNLLEYLFMVHKVG